MDKHFISLADTQQFTPLVLDYVSHQDHLKEYIQDFISDEAILKQCKLKTFTAEQRALLKKELELDYANQTMTDGVRKHLDLLLHENTFTITTAHQPVIFLGPLYIAYKIVQTIVLAQHYTERFPDYHFVPVFYLGNEDHDLDEIGTISIGNSTYRWQTQQQGACGEMRCEGLLELWQRIAEEHPVSEALSQIIQAAYQPEHTITQAYQHLLHALFGEYGLLVFDANKAVFKQCFTRVLEDELFNQSSFKLVTQCIESLETKYKIQAHPRPINLFYKTSQQRIRIEPTSTGFTLADHSATFSEEAMRSEIQHHPERFSPNVILRPVLQELLLPNVVWIGGGGELAYWLQLKSVFVHHQVTYPLLRLRNSVQFITQSQRQALEAIPLPVEDLFKSLHGLQKNRWLQSEAYQQASLATEKIVQDFEPLHQQAELLSPNLKQSVEAHEAKTARILKRIREKFLSQLIQQDHAVSKQIETIQLQCLPKGKLQERVHSFIDLYLLYAEDFIPLLCNNLEADKEEFLILMD